MSEMVVSTATIVLPVGLLLAIGLNVFALIKSDKVSTKTDTLLTEVINRQNEHQNCLGVLRDNAIKQTTILEAIRDNTKR